jgi:hypothetical protein
MDITDASKTRRALAIECFCNHGEAFSYYGVTFYVDKLAPKPMLVVASWSEWLPENTKPDMAREKIERSKAVLEELINQEIDFAICVADKPRILEFLYDYGTGGLLLAQEEDGNFKWLQ